MPGEFVSISDLEMLVDNIQQRPGFWSRQFVYEVLQNLQYYKLYVSFGVLFKVCVKAKIRVRTDLCAVVREAARCRIEPQVRPTLRFKLESLAHR